MHMHLHTLSGASSSPKVLRVSCLLSSYLSFLVKNRPKLRNENNIFNKTGGNRNHRQ